MSDSVPTEKITCRSLTCLTLLASIYVLLAGCATTVIDTHYVHKAADATEFREALTQKTFGCSADCRQCLAANCQSLHHVMFVILSIYMHQFGAFLRNTCGSVSVLGERK